MNDDLTLLASAYLDGDVTADERALVESDPQLLGEVERLRSVRIMLADTEPASISLREQHLANALDAWDTVMATAADRTPTPFGERRRRRSNRILLGAAAAIMVVFAGGIALQTFTGGESSDEASFDAATAATPTDPPVAALAEPGEAAGSQRAATDPEPASAESADVADSSTLDTVDTGIADPAPPGDLELEQLSTTEELGIFASDAVDAPTSPDVPAATSAPIDDQLTATQATILDAELPRCLDVDYVVGPALYQGTEVVVGVDTSRDLALAYRAANCREVARAPLP
jgi:hypothetical protein